MYMYAVIKTGGKQYKVSPGEIVRVERLAGNIGERVSFDNVLMVNTDQDVKIGNPQLTGIPVIGEIIDQGKSKKIRIVKKKRRKKNCTARFLKSRKKRVQRANQPRHIRPVNMSPAKIVMYIMNLNVTGRKRLRSHGKCGSMIRKTQWRRGSGGIVVSHERHNGYF